MTRLWMIRLGKFGEQEQHALETGELVTGWTLPDMSAAGSRDAILPLLQAAYPTEKPGTLANWAAQLNQLKNVADAGDLIVTPLKTTGQLAVGRLVGGYSHGDQGNPIRTVEWLRKDLPRTSLKQDLLYSLGATQTVCEISRNDAVKRVAAAAQGGADPGYGSAGVITSPKSSPVEDADEVETTDLADLARDQIEKRISSQFAGHAFTQLIAAILNAQGYRTEVSPPGPDRSVDILAGQGPLGMTSPRFVVQVKSGDIVADQPTLQGLIGSITDVHADHGLLVSWSGFTQAVRRRVNELYFRVRLWDRKDIVDALLDAYDDLPESIRAELPLRRIWTLVPESDEVG
jgi:restriction system protein